MSESDLWPPIGAVVCGKYRVERLIGRGGMGVVMLAHHLRLDEDVALKFLTPQARAKPDVVARFEREARALVKLKSPHVARVLDVEVAENGAPFIVMEYLEGQTLAGLVRGGAALPTELAVEYILQACEAVAEAHAIGIVHRDIKPANLFLTTGPDGSAVVKILDFGVSKLSALDGSTPLSGGDVETLPDTVVGSPPYMSPEQLRSSRDVDVRTDVWALGVCLFEIVTGRMPFAAQNLHEHYTRLMLDPAPLPSEVRSDLPPVLDDIVKKCLQREPDDRYANVGELARDLAQLAPERALASADRVERTLSVSRPQARRSTPSLPAPPITSSIHSSARATRLTAPRRATRARWMLAGASCFVLAIATFVVVEWRTPQAHAPTATVQTPTPTPTLATPPPALTQAPTVVAPTLTPSITPTATHRVRPIATASAKPIDDGDLEHRK